jgi:hypothetical protein
VTTKADEAAERVIELIESVTNVTREVDDDWSKLPAAMPFIDDGLALVNDERDSMPGNLKPELLRTPLNCATLVGKKPDRDYLQLHHAREITDIRQVRGKVTQLMPFIVRWRVAHIREDGKLLGPIEDIFAGYNGTDWREITSPSGRDNGYRLLRLNPRTVEEMTQQCGLMYGGQFYHEYNWIVTAGYRRNIHIALPTNALGVREFLALRDREGKSRRSSLRHWVEQHWRNLPSDLELETQVRAHLRGKEAYNWGDLDGFIIPAQVTMEAATRAAEERAASGPLRRPRTSPATRAEELRMAAQARADDYRRDYERHLRGEPSGFIVEEPSDQAADH